MMPAGYAMRVAEIADFPAIRAFYNQLIDDLSQKEYHPMWDKEGHPADAYLRQAIEGHELLIVECEGDVVAALVVNGEANDGYKSVPWKVDASEGEFIIVHAFGVSSRHQGKGLGSAIMRAVMQQARAEGKKAIRLDLIDHNLPTGQVYVKLGFQPVAQVELYYAEVGWQTFHMFEYAL